MMKRVTGIGGVFFKVKDPQAMRDWYGKHLGIPHMSDMEAALNGDKKKTRMSWVILHGA